MPSLSLGQTPAVPEEIAFQRAELVLEVQLLKQYGCDKYCSVKVKILQILKNKEQAPLGKTLIIYYLSTPNRLPSKCCTVFLERYNLQGKTDWKLLDGLIKNAVKSSAGKDKK